MRAFGLKLVPGIILIVSVIFSCGGCGTAVSDEQFAQRIDQYMAKLNVEKRFMGSILVKRRGKVILSKGYGMENLEDDVPNTPRTKFRLGSLTKQFTAMAVMILHERRSLDTSDPICKYVPQCPTAWLPITVHNLLTHTSGIPNLTELPGYNETTTQPSTVSQTIARFKSLPLRFDPGTKIEYSNSGYIVLGMIIETVSGQTYEDFIDQNIFTPLDMNDSGYDHYNKIIKHRAEGYTVRGNDIERAPYIDMSIPFSAGSLYSTVEDLSRWDEALYTEKLVSKKSLDAMFTPYTANYGYGWTIDKALNRIDLNHSGGINGFATHIARYPEDRVLIVVLSNLDVAPVAQIAGELAQFVFIS